MTNKPIEPSEALEILKEGIEFTYECLEHDDSYGNKPRERYQTALAALDGVNVFFSNVAVGENAYVLVFDWDNGRRRWCVDHFKFEGHLFTCTEAEAECERRNKEGTK